MCILKKFGLVVCGIGKQGPPSVSPCPSPSPSGRLSGQNHICRASYPSAFRLIKLATWFSLCCASWFKASCLRIQAWITHGVSWESRSLTIRIMVSVFFEYYGPNFFSLWVKQASGDIHLQDSKAKRMTAKCGRWFQDVHCMV